MRSMASSGIADKLAGSQFVFADALAVEQHQRVLVAVDAETAQVELRIGLPELLRTSDAARALPAPRERSVTALSAGLARVMTTAPSRQVLARYWKRVAVTTTVASSCSSAQALGTATGQRAGRRRENLGLHASLPVPAHVPARRVIDVVMNRKRSGRSASAGCRLPATLRTLVPRPVSGLVSVERRLTFAGGASPSRARCAVAAGPVRILLDVPALTYRCGGSTGIACRFMKPSVAARFGRLTCFPFHSCGWWPRGAPRNECREQSAAAREL